MKNIEVTYEDAYGVEKTAEHEGVFEINDGGCLYIGKNLINMRLTASAIYARGTWRHVRYVG